MTDSKRVTFDEPEDVTTSADSGVNIPVEESGPRKLIELLETAVTSQADETYSATAHTPLPDTFADHAQVAIPHSVDDHNRLV